MKKSKKTTFEPVSVIIVMRNAVTTVVKALESIARQKYPIKEILVVDNKSKDNSRELVRDFAKKSRIAVRLLLQEKDKGVSSSYNLGTKSAKARFVVFMMSDCYLPSEKELEKLTEPLRRDPQVVGSFPTTILPRSIWNEYNFWQKLYMVSGLDNTRPLMNAKFDCIRRDVFLSIGGFDEENFGGESNIGGEDAELSLRLQKEGKVVASKAQIIHLHYMGSDYSLSHLLRSRKMYARTYGRLLRKRGHLFPIGAVVFLVKPALAILPIIPFFRLVGMLLLIVYAFMHTQKMYTAKNTIMNPRIFILPLLNIFLLYYDTFWMFQAFFVVPAKQDKI